VGVVRWLPVAIGAAVLPLVAAIAPAHAAACAQVSITPAVQGPKLTPAKVTITAGGCASYVNNTALPVTVKVGKVSGSADPNNAVTFREPAPGTFAVSARQQFQGQAFGGTGSGTLVVRTVARPSPSPTSRPGPSGSPSPAPRPSASQSSGPQVAPSSTVPPPTAPGVTPSLSPVQPSGNPPIVVGIPPSSDSSTPSAAVVAGPLQPPSGRGVGLPAAVAALLVVGAGAAFARVLLAEPLRAVDGGRYVVGAP
jgi:hypothetical protein